MTCVTLLKFFSFVPGVVPERTGEMETDDAQAGGQVGRQIWGRGHERHGDVSARIDVGEHPAAACTESPLHAPPGQPFLPGLLVRDAGAPPRRGISISYH